MSSENETSETWQEHLIELVRVRPCLYDKANRNYYDKDVKANNWKDVSSQLLEAGYTYLKDGQTGIYHFMCPHSFEVEIHKYGKY